MTSTTLFMCALLCVVSSVCSSSAILPPICGNSPCQCPPGQAYRTGKGCTPCAAGTIQRGFFCSGCPAHHFQPEEGKTECLPCPPSQSSTYGSAKCTSCPPGQAPLKDNQCGVCPPGKYFIPDSVLCNICPKNTFKAGNDLSTTCSACPEGSSSAVGAASCTVCPAGQAIIQFPNEPMTPLQYGCGSCEGGQFYSAYRQDCLKCAPNTFSAGGVPTECEKCAEGSFALPGSAACTLCAKGEVLLLSGCGRCKAGEGLDAYYGTCEECGPNRVSDGLSECTQCGAGTFTRKGTFSCTPCASGTALDYDSGQCITCSAGQYYSLFSGKCEACVFGVAGEANVNTEPFCELCARGTGPNRERTACVERNAEQDERTVAPLVFL